MRPGGPPLLSQALGLFQAGRLGEAEALLRHCVAQEPQRADAAELLGASLSAQGRYPEALQWFDRARALKPTSPSIRLNRAQVLFGLGRPEEARDDLHQAVTFKPDMQPAWRLLGAVLAALGDGPGAERAYRRALALQPNDPDTFYNLGLFFHESGRLEEAVASYRRAVALRPAFAAAHNNLANALKVRGHVDEALQHYAQAVRHDPQLGDAFSNYGTALRELGRVDEAIPLLERARALKPQSWFVQNNLGIAYFERNRFHEAVDCYRQALAARDDFHEARNNLGNALAALGHEVEAIECYRRVIEAVPEHADAHSNLGLLLQERGQVDDAMRCYSRTLGLKPDHADALNNYGYLLQEQGRRGDAMALYRRAMDANPRSARAAYNLGLAMLCEMQFEEGWRLCELRYQTTPPVAVPRPFAVPPLRLADIGHGHRTALWREQGVGDQLLYSTLLPELDRRGERFVLEVDRRLVPAYRRAYPHWSVVAPEDSDNAFAACDRHASLASVPGLLRRTKESFAGQPHALLSADPARAADYRARLAPGAALVVGLSWRSFQPSPRGYLQRKKSSTLAAFLPLSGREGWKLLDLQYGDTQVERSAFAAGGGRLERLEDLDLFNDLEGVLAAIEACDVVVTTSNVTAHLAGAIGKRTLLVYLGANPPFHYWVTDESGRCLWYPSVRIVTGASLTSWDQAVRHVAELLEG